MRRASAALLSCTRIGSPSRWRPWSSDRPSTSVPSTSLVLPTPTTRSCCSSSSSPTASTSDPVMSSHSRAILPPMRSSGAPSLWRSSRSLKLVVSAVTQPTGRAGTHWRRHRSRCRWHRRGHRRWSPAPATCRRGCHPDLSPAFHNDWSLSDAELAVLADWAAGGGGLDVAPDTPLVAAGEVLVPIRRHRLTTRRLPMWGRSIGRTITAVRCTRFPTPKVTVRGSPG